LNAAGSNISVVLVSVNVGHLVEWVARFAGFQVELLFGVVVAPFSLERRALPTNAARCTSH
jgi:hypothetical protein